jgi:hypothetical protein
MLFGSPLIAGLIGWFMSTFGLIGAVLVTLVATSLVKAAAVVRIARLMNVGVADVLPWRRLAAAAVHAGIAVVPAWWVMRVPSLPPSGGADLECRRRTARRSRPSGTCAGRGSDPPTDRR